MPASPPLRIVYLGMTGAFSMLLLAALLRSRHTVAAVLVAGDRRKSPALTPLPPPAPTGDLPLLSSFINRSIIDLAWESEIDLYRVHDPSARGVADLVHDLGADVGCIACFDRLIRDPLRSAPRLGFLNVHPSLLPAYRGPSPLFWTFRDGVSETGVTIHQVDAGMDTGPILTQAPLTLADGLTGPEADRLAAALGGDLLVRALDGLADGTITPHPQPEGGWANPLPQIKDFHLDRNWSARRAFNFMRGAAEWGRPFVLDLPMRHLSLARALSYNESAKLGHAAHIDGHHALIQFSPGVLEANLT
jgi:methionyl-tRNA formyltransferase